MPYKGPVYMTHPTKAIMPIMLEDYHKVCVFRWGKDRPSAVRIMQAVGHSGGIPQQRSR